MNQIVLFLWVLSLNFHVGHLAVFKFQHVDDRLMLTLTMEYGELKNFGLNLCENNAAMALCTTKYINDHLEVRIDNESIGFELQEARKLGDHYVIQLTSIQKVPIVDNIAVVNRCFYEFYEAFKNRVVIQTATIRKSFLLTKKSSTIVVETNP